MDITISPVVSTDFHLVYPLVSNANVMQYVGNTTPWTKERLSKFLQYSENDWKHHNNKWYQWKITTTNNTNNTNTKQLVGLVSLHLFPHKQLPKDLDLKTEYFLTIFLAKEYQGKGYTTHILKKVIDLFKELQPKKQSIYALTLKSNVHAQKSFLKNGFKMIRTVRLGGRDYLLLALNV